MTTDLRQLSFYDVLGPLGARTVFHMAAEPGWAWYQCRDCREFQYRRRLKRQRPCILTPRCRGEMSIYRECICQACGRVVTRRKGDPGYCSRGCEPEGSS